MSLNDSEVKVVVAIAVLQSLGKAPTVAKISKVTNIDKGYVRNILLKLERMGLLRVYTSAGFGFMGSIPEGKVWVLREDLEEIVEKHPEIIEWAKRIPEEELRANSKEELIRKIKNIGNTKLGEEILRRLEST